MLSPQRCHASLANRRVGTIQDLLHHGGGCCLDKRYSFIIIVVTLPSLPPRWVLNHGHALEVCYRSCVWMGAAGPGREFPVCIGSSHAVPMAVRKLFELLREPILWQGVELMLRFTFCHLSLFHLGLFCHEEQRPISICRIVQWKFVFFYNSLHYLIKLVIVVSGKFRVVRCSIPILDPHCRIEIGVQGSASKRRKIIVICCALGRWLLLLGSVLRLSKKNLHSTNSHSENEKLLVQTCTSTQMNHCTSDATSGSSIMNARRAPTALARCAIALLLHLHFVQFRVFASIFEIARTAVPLCYGKR